MNTHAAARLIVDSFNALFIACSFLNIWINNIHESHVGIDVPLYI
ncbi:hypothetical protein ACTHQF_06700 [Pedobacter sp. SAFR-022]